MQPDVHIRARARENRFSSLFPLLLPFICFIITRMKRYWILRAKWSARDCERAFLFVNASPGKSIYFRDIVDLFLLSPSLSFTRSLINRGTLNRATTLR